MNESQAMSKSSDAMTNNANIMITGKSKVVRRTSGEGFDVNNRQLNTKQ